MARNPKPSNRNSPLSPRKTAKAIKDCIVLFSLLCLVVVPAVVQYMVILLINNFSIDPRKNIKQLLNIIKNRTVTVIPIVAKDTLDDALEAVNNVCHMNLSNVYWERKKYLKSWIWLCNEMGNGTAETLLKRHLLFDRSINTSRDSLLPTTDPMYNDLLKAIDLYTILIKEVTPALNSYFKRRGIAQNEDAYRLLERMVQEVDSNPLWIGGRNHKQIVHDSFDGRNAACHMELALVSSTHKMFIKSWMDLCYAIRENQAGDKLRTIYNRR